MSTSARNWLIFFGAIILTIAVVGLLVSIFEHKQEAKLTFNRLTEIAPGEPNSDLWKANFPREYDGYIKTMKTS
ncbi:hypothetical protein EHM69_00155, partial [candidate division KSB1 bacterium]